MSAAASQAHTSEAFHDPRLSPQQNKAVEMLRNGFKRDEICEEMEISDEHLRTLFYQARKKGVEVPKGKRVYPSVPIARLVDARRHIRESSGKRGEHEVIAARFGITRNCAAVRLWFHDHGRRN